MLDVRVRTGAPHCPGGPAAVVTSVASEKGPYCGQDCESLEHMTHPWFYMHCGTWFHTHCRLQGNIILMPIYVLISWLWETQALGNDSRGRCIDQQKQRSTKSCCSGEEKTTNNKRAGKRDRSQIPTQRRLSVQGLRALKTNTRDKHSCDEGDGQVTDQTHLLGIQK